MVAVAATVYTGISTDYSENESVTQFNAAVTVGGLVCGGQL